MRIQTNESLHSLSPKKTQFQHSTQKKTKTSYNHRLTDSPGSVLWSYYVCASTLLLSGMMAKWECVKGRHDQTPMGGTSNPVVQPEGERGGGGGGHSVFLLSNQPLLSILPALCSSWLFPFVCLSGDNGRLSVTQGLTQIHSVRRRTGSGMMGISQPFTHETNPP